MDPHEDVLEAEEVRFRIWIVDEAALFPEEVEPAMDRPRGDDGPVRPEGSAELVGCEPGLVPCQEGQELQEGRVEEVRVSGSPCCERL